jgi:hypothetical protein
MVTPATEAISYLKWKKDVEQHNHAAASSYLSIRFGESRAQQVAGELQKLPIIMRRANDVLRAVGRAALPLSDPGVLKDLKKVLSGPRCARPGRWCQGRAIPCAPYCPAARRGHC